MKFLVVGDEGSFYAQSILLNQKWGMLDNWNFLQEVHSCMEGMSTFWKEAEMHTTQSES